MAQSNSISGAVYGGLWRINGGLRRTYGDIMRSNVGVWRNLVDLWRTYVGLWRNLIDFWRSIVGFWRSKLHLTCSQKAATSNQDIKQEQPGSRLPGDHYRHDEGADVFVLLCNHHGHDEGADFFIVRVRGDGGDQAYAGGVAQGDVDFGAG